MAKQFRGRFEAKIDQKGRLSLPKGILTQLSEKSQSFVITNSQYKGYRSLDMYTKPAWSKLESRISKLPSLQNAVQDFQRFYLAGGQDVAMDSQKRVLVPGPLRRYSQIEGEVVLVGMGDKLEIWSAEVWHRLYDRLANQFDETLSAVAALDDREK